MGQALKLQGVILLLIVGAMWLEEAVDLSVFGGALDRLGIQPRNPNWLWGILLAPFLHGGFAHLMANTPPFLVLGWLVMLRRLRDFFVVALTAMLVGGAGVWVLGAPGSVHIGASGVVFGFLGYLLLRGYFERSFTAILLAVVVAVVYGGALWGLLPTQPGVSWEGHLFGFLGGGGAARLLRRPQPLARGRV